MPYGPKHVRVKCQGSGRLVTVGDQLGSRPDLYSCPWCHLRIHRKADGTMPPHDMKQIRW